MHRFLVGLLVVAIACGGDASTGPSGDVSGTYDLKTINGMPLPFVFPPSGGTTTTITSSVLVLAGNGTYSEQIGVKAVTGTTTSTSTITELGTWTAFNGAITFTDHTDNVTYHGSVSGSTLTEINNGYTSVYQRR
jgi:hypothetical protein